MDITIHIPTLREALGYWKLAISALVVAGMLLLMLATQSKSQPALAGLPPTATPTQTPTPTPDPLLGSISGTVTEDGTGVPLQDICVTIRTALGMFIDSTSTNASGLYSVGGLQPGNYQVLFRHCFFPAGHWSEWYNNHIDGSAADSVIVQAGTKTAGIDAALAVICSPTCPKPAVRIGSDTIPVGAQTVLNLEALNMLPPGLGAWTIDVSYDPSVLSVLSCTPVISGVCNPAFSSTTVRDVGAEAWGLEQDVTLAAITYECINAGSSPLTISVAVLADATVGGPQPIAANAINGSVTCTASPKISITSVFQDPLPKTCFDVMDSGQVALFTVCDNDFQGAPASHAACNDGTDTICNDEDPAEGSVTITVDPAIYHVEVGKTPLNITADATKAVCSGGPACSLTFTNTSGARPWNPWDVAGPGQSWPPDGVVDLPNDILSVILHFCPLASDPCAKP